MKKILSVILAIIMIASVTPTAFATEECEHIYNTDNLVRPTIKSEGYFVCSACGENIPVKLANYSEFNEAYGRLISMEFNVYSSEESYDELIKKADKAYQNLLSFINTSGMDTVLQATEYEQDYVDALTQILNQNTEPLVENIVFDGIEIGVASALFSHYELYYGDSIYEIPTEETNNALEEAFYELVLIQQKVLENPTSVTQDEYDAFAAKVISFFMLTISCAEGKHSYETASDNGDGTHSADCTFCSATNTVNVHTFSEYTVNEDGTETAVCDFCEATDTRFSEDNSKEEEKTDFNDLDLFEKLKVLVSDFFELLMSALKAFFG